MPDVLVLSEYPTTSGGERSMLAVLEGVGRAGFCVSVAAPPAGPLADALRARGVEVVPFTTRDLRGRRLPQERLRDRLRGILARRRPHLVHANSLSMGRLSGPVAAELGIPSIVHLRDIMKLSAQAVADLNRHTRLLAVSRATRDFCVAAGLAPEKTRVLYNGVDLDAFRPREPSGYLHRELGLPPGARLVGAVGQIGLRKGLDVLARAAVLLKDKLPDAHYLIAGERWSQKAESREFEAELRAVAADDLPGRMHLLGYRNDVPRLLNEWTLLVHPSRQEPLGRVLLEAAASGTAVVATGVGGTPEIFPPGTGSARLVPPDDPAAVAAAISELFGNPSSRARLATAARRRARHAFDAAGAAAGLAEHYRQVGHVIRGRES